MWTKRELVNQAFAELALAGYEFELTPEETQSALIRMDTMLAEWQGRGISLGYNLPASPSDSDLSEPSGLPDYAVSGVYTNLALRTAGMFGKTPPQTLIAAAAQGMQALWSIAAIPQQQQLRGSMPIGAGNKYWRGPGRRFVTPPDLSPVQTGPSGNLDFLES
jgi:hypothetical protein